MEVNLVEYQWDFLTDETPIKLLHGGRGSGKTYLLAMSMYNKAALTAGMRICVVCNDHVQLRESTLAALEGYLNDIGCPYKYHKQNKIITFPNGSTIALLTFEKDKTALKGPEWDACFIDEADGKNTTEDKFDYLIDSVRGKLGDCSITICCNPVYPGHFLAKRFFEEKWDDHKGWMVSTYMNEANLKAGYIKRLETKYGHGSDEWKRMMMGQLINMKGAVYKMFGDEHIVKPSEVPDAKAILYGQDLGKHDPHVLLEGHIDSLGVLYIAREYYCPHKDIVEHLPDLKNMYQAGWPVFSDHSANIQSIMLNEGFNWVNAFKEKEHGIQMVASRFLAGTLKISTDCKNLIRELYRYLWRPPTPGGKEETYHEFSHAPDALRYMVAGLDKESLFF